MDNALSVGEVRTLCEDKGTKIQSLPAFSPWINGLAESAVKHCKRGLRKLRHQYGDDWPRYFHDLLFAHRICVRSSTLFSSFKLVYGREPVLPVERMFAQRYQVQLTSPDEEVDKATERCLEDIVATRRLNAFLRATRQELLSRSAAFNQDARQQHAIQAFRKRQHRGAYRAAQLEPGCKVLMRKTRKGHPLDLGWEGPYQFVGYMDENRPSRHFRRCQPAALEPPRHPHPPLPRERGREGVVRAGNLQNPTPPTPRTRSVCASQLGFKISSFPLSKAER